MLSRIAQRSERVASSDSNIESLKVSLDQITPAEKVRSTNREEWQSGLLIGTRSNNSSDGKFCGSGAKVGRNNSEEFKSGLLIGTRSSNSSNEKFGGTGVKANINHYSEECKSGLLIGTRSSNSSDGKLGASGPKNRSWESPNTHTPKALRKKDKEADWNLSGSLTSIALSKKK
jgi:hypothetical protein